MTDRLNPKQRQFIDHIYKKLPAPKKPPIFERWGRDFLEITLLYFNDLTFDEILEKLKSGEPRTLILEYMDSENPIENKPDNAQEFQIFTQERPTPQPKL